MVGRMTDGATVDLVQQQVDAVNRQNDERFPETKQILADAHFHTVVVKLQDDLVRDIKSSLYLLWGGVIFVLVIGCVNLANLMIVRSASRSREMATRHALGGEMGRLARQLLTETTVLALVGGVAGVLLAWWATRSVASLNLDQLPRGYEIHLDPMGLAFAFALTVGVGLVLGVAPALRLRHMNLNLELREEGRGGTSGRRAQQARRVLAMIQVAIALEQFGYGFGFTAYLMYMIHIARGEHPTAHYAICTGFMAMGMMVPGMWSGWLQDHIGYRHFFLVVILATIPSFLVATRLRIDESFGRKAAA